MKDNVFKLAQERSRRYSAQTITDADYADDIALQVNTPAQAKTLLHSLEQAAAGIGLHVKADKTEYLWFNQKGDIPTLNGSCLKLMDKFTYQGISVSSTENDINPRLAKAWTAIESLSVITQFLQSSGSIDTAISMYYMDRTEKKLDGNYTRMLRAILNKSWRLHPTKQQLYGHLPPTTKTIQVIRTRHAGHMPDTAEEVGTSS